MFINTGLSFMNIFAKVYNYNTVQIIPRIPDAFDKQFDECKLLMILLKIKKNQN